MDDKELYAWARAHMKEMNITVVTAVQHPAPSGYYHRPPQTTKNEIIIIDYLSMMAPKRCVA